MSTEKYIEFREVQTKLTEKDIDELVALIGSRCRHETKARIRSVLTYSPSTIPDYGIMRRLMFYRGSWTYTAGQSYPDEIRVVRNIIIKGRP